MSDPTALPLEPEDDILAFTHTKRKQIVNDLMKDGKIPADQQDAKHLITVLADMDKAALGRKRIKVEERQNNNQEQMAGVVAMLLQRASGSAPYRAPIPVERTIPTLGAEIPDPVLVDGETATTATQQDYETFVAKSSEEDEPATD